MKVVIGADHFDQAKQQAHELREQLINQSVFNSLESIHTKSAFLNTWADTLGYDDWGDFQAQTKHAHKDNTGNIIISPDTIEYLAKKLCEKSYFQSGDVGLFEDALFLSAVDHEKALFHEDDVKFYSKSLGDPDFPITLELGPPNYQSHLVEYLFNTHSMVIGVTSIEKEFLQYAKDKRKERGLTKKSDISFSELDIYPNSGKKANNIITEALKEEWIESFISYDWREVKEFYRLSTRAINWLYGSWSEDYGDEWLQWNKRIDQLLSKSSDEKRIEPKFLRLKGYIKEKKPEDYIQDIIHIPDTDPVRTWANDSRRKSVVDDIEIDIEDYQFPEPIFHVVPRLLLDYDEVQHVKTNKLSASVLIEFINKDGDIIQLITIEENELNITKPHPNKRHVAAETSDDHIGKYLRVPDGSVKIKCCYTWKDLAAGISIEHKLIHPLTQMKGNSLFSAHHSHNFDNVLHQGRDKPISFFSLNAINGSASNIEELQSTNRFIDQLYRFERKNGVVMIEEHFPLTASALHYYY
jgi:hypothetical protein